MTIIGVIADPSEQDIIREFFEFFKTPWEFYSKDRQYEVLLCAGDHQVDEAARLILVYSGGKTRFDDFAKIRTGPQRPGNCILSYQGNRIPIYGNTVRFSGRDGILTDEQTNESAAYLDQSGQGAVVRIGYDLFGEIRTLLTLGQPSANANIPTLELHIALLRDLITGCGIPLAEIPPVPDDYPFIACLTHDVDNPSIRQHKWDHTAFGFLYRAVFESSYKFLRGRIPVQSLLANWAAALKLPFVYMGLAEDFWHGFDDRYRELEKGLCSTYFVIPFKDRPGKSGHGSAPKFRAARYEARDIEDKIKKIVAAGCEVGLHGIDAWLDSSRGHEELEEIRRLAGVSAIGVRMHWLYYNQESPVALENAGAAYDSTIGYNDTVGYRAGTTQVYKPLQVSQLLEIPLHVMDTALFYLSYLGLSSRQARKHLSRMLNNAERFGGCLTINWHDRSLAPERLWDTCYCDMIQDLRSRGAWFSTTAEAVAWFRKRRSVVFEKDWSEPDAVRARVSANNCGGVPGLRLRIHKGRKWRQINDLGSEDYLDLAFHESVDTQVPCAATAGATLRNIC